MNQAKVKAERRAIRRAFGPDLLAVVNDHDKGIQTLIAAVQRLESLRVSAVEARALASSRVDQQVDALEQLIDHDRLILKRPLLGRLRWLVTGA